MAHGLEIQARKGGKVMKPLFYKIGLLSDALPASGITTSAVIDTDVAADDLGMPFIPAKRIKGLLLESLTEVGEITGHKTGIDTLFGKVGEAGSQSFFISDAKVENYESFNEWLNWAKSEHPGVFQPDSITDTFTNIRRQTKLKNGIAVNHSLRSSRVLNKGLKFSGTITKNGGFNEKETAQLALAFSNLRYFGVNRNRGFGFIQCILYDRNQQPVDLKKSLAEVQS